MSKTLSERITKNFGDEKKKGSRNHNKAVFISLKNDIKAAIQDGWSIRSIWQTLHDEGTIHFKYITFLKYVKAHIHTDTPNTPKAEAAPEYTVQTYSDDQVPPSPESAQADKEVIRERDKPEYAGLTPRQRRERIAQKFIDDTPTHPLVEKFLNKK